MLLNSLPGTLIFRLSLITFFAARQLPNHHMILYAKYCTLGFTSAPELLETMDFFLAGPLFSTSESALLRLPLVAVLPAALPIPAVPNAGSCNDAVNFQVLGLYSSRELGQILSLDYAQRKGGGTSMRG